MCVPIREKQKIELQWNETENCGELLVGWLIDLDGVLTLTLLRAAWFLLPYIDDEMSDPVPLGG